MITKNFYKVFSLIQSYRKYIYTINKNQYFFYIIFFLCFIFFIPFLCINRFLPLTLRLHFARFRTDRIGHFVNGFHIRYAKKNLNLINKNFIYSFDLDISNKFLAYQVRKFFAVNYFVKYIVMICEIVPFLNCLVDKETFNAGIDKQGLILKSEMPDFSYNENSFAYSWLKKNGWKGLEQKIVILHIRDSAYLNNIYDKQKWNYHSYRDSNIDDFHDVILWLISKGYFVVRTGKFANKKIHINSPYFIDYPFSNSQDDLLDIWLFANSSLVITTGSGIDEIAYGYKVPIIHINFMPLGQSHSWKKSLTIPKRLFWKDSNKHLNLDEYLKFHNFFRTDDYDKANIKIIDLSKEEIFEIVKEGYAYFIEGKPIKREDLLITNKFRETIINSKDDIRDYHEFFNPEFVLSSNVFNVK